MAQSQGSLLYWFLRAAITSHRELGGPPRTTEVHSLTVLEVQSQAVSGAVIPSEEVWGEPFLVSS